VDVRNAQEAFVADDGVQISAAHVNR
jgi:hypothetical protein